MIKGNKRVPNLIMSSDDIEKLVRTEEVLATSLGDMGS